MVTTDFQLVKTLWQTRVGRSKSLSSHLISDREATPREEDYRKLTVMSNGDALASQTTAVDADTHQSTKKLNVNFVLDASPVVSMPSPTTPRLSSTPSPSTATVVCSSGSPEALSDTSLLDPATSMCKTFSGMENESYPAPVSSFVGSSSLFSFSPPVRNPWRSSRSASDATLNSSFSSSTTSFSFTSVNLMSLSPREAAENAINNVHNVCPRSRLGPSRSISFGSPYGELFIVDILEARGLGIERDESGNCASVAITMQLGRTSQQTAPIDPISLVSNERFVFWIPSSPTIDQRTIDFFVHEGKTRELGEVHLSLAMPLNEAFGDWYPLVCRADGQKHGSLRVAMRRVVLTSSPMEKAAKTLGEQQSCLKFRDSSIYGDLLPELWACFPGQEPEVTSSSPSNEKETGSKFGRLIGYHDVRRNVF